MTACKKVNEAGDQCVHTLGHGGAHYDGWRHQWHTCDACKQIVCVVWPQDGLWICEPCARKGVTMVTDNSNVSDRVSVLRSDLLLMQELFMQCRRMAQAHDKQPWAAVCMSDDEFNAWVRIRELVGMGPP